MKELLDKLSSYNIFNYLLPGILFCIILKSFTKYDFTQENIIIGAFLYYFIGLIVSRIGSLTLEPLLQKTKFVEFAKYTDFITASKKDAKIETLSEVNNMYRTICSLLLLTLIMKLYEWLSSKVDFLNDYSLHILIILLIGLFLFSYRKQTDYVRNSVIKNIENDR